MLDAPTLKTISEVMDRARTTPYLLTWEPKDVELVDLYEEAAEVEDDLKATPQETEENIELRSKLRQELQDALENDAHRWEKFCL